MIISLKDFTLTHYRRRKSSTIAQSTISVINDGSKEKTIFIIDIEKSLSLNGQNKWK